MNAILLAGGDSSRYGSNKAFIEWQGDYLIEYLISELDKFFNEVYVVVDDKNNFKFIKKGIIVEDLIPGQGPLAGLYTGLKYSSARFNYLTACDMPCLVSSYIKYLKEHKRNYQVLVSSYKGFLEPFAAVYSRECIPLLEKSFAVNNLKITAFYPDDKTVIIPEKKLRKLASPQKIFFNINYKSDLNEIKCKKNRRN